MQVIYTRSLVHIYSEGSLLAAYPRDPRPGRYTTAAEHLCSQHQHYLNRSPEYYLRRARRAGPALVALVEKIFSQDRYPEQLYRTCDGLLALWRKADPEAFTRACCLALEHQNYTWRFIDNVLKNKMTGHPKPEDSKPLPKHRNVRGRDYYQQTLKL